MQRNEPSLPLRTGGAERMADLLTRTSEPCLTLYEGKCAGTTRPSDIFLRSLVKTLSPGLALGRERESLYVLPPRVGQPPANQNANVLEQNLRRFGKDRFHTLPAFSRPTLPNRAPQQPPHTWCGRCGLYSRGTPPSPDSPQVGSTATVTFPANNAEDMLRI